MLHSEKSSDTGELILDYAEDPKSGLPLLLLHGLPGRRQAFEPLMPHLAPIWRVVRYDLRGHGKSGKVAGQYHLLDYAKDTIAPVQALFTGSTPQPARLDLLAPARRGRQAHEYRSNSITNNEEALSCPNTISPSFAVSC